MYDLSEREKRALQAANGINAILSQSSIKSGAENAQQRGKQQAADRLQRQRDAKRQAEMEATLALRQQQGELNREADAERTGVVADALTTAQRNALPGMIATGQQYNMVNQAIEGNDSYIDPVQDAMPALWRALGANSFANWIQSDNYSPEDKRTRTEIENLVTAYRKGNFGTALTGFEISESSKWHPLAPGIEPAESKQRLGVLKDAHERQYNALLNAGGAQPAESATSDDEYEYRTLPDGTRQRRRK